uniref:CxxxxCH/CxxCH domain-containing protein n=1 Tax=Corynebacterium falsenii TaxID=108486 RepID=UPI0035BE5DC1
MKHRSELVVSVRPHVADGEVQIDLSLCGRCTAVRCHSCAPVSFSLPPPVVAAWTSEVRANRT